MWTKIRGSACVIYWALLCLDNKSYAIVITFWGEKGVERNLEKILVEKTGFTKNYPIFFEKHPKTLRGIFDDNFTRLIEFCHSIFSGSFYSIRVIPAAKCQNPKSQSITFSLIVCASKTQFLTSIITAGKDENGKRISDCMIIWLLHFKAFLGFLSFSFHLSLLFKKALKTIEKESEVWMMEKREKKNFHVIIRIGDFCWAALIELENFGWRYFFCQRC